MYNRYIRNESGGYTRIPMPPPPPHDPPPHHDEPPPRHEPPPHHPPPPPGPPPPRNDPFRLLGRFMNGLKLDSMDSGDILLLLILFFLYQEKADEEVLIALGLLLFL